MRKLGANTATVIVTRSLELAQNKNGQVSEALISRMFATVRYWQGGCVHVAHVYGLACMRTHDPGHDGWAGSCNHILLAHNLSHRQ